MSCRRAPTPLAGCLWGLTPWRQWYVPAAARSRPGPPLYCLWSTMTTQRWSCFRQRRSCRRWAEEGGLGVGVWSVKGPEGAAGSGAKGHREGRGQHGNWSRLREPWVSELLGGCLAMAEARGQLGVADARGGRTMWYHLAQSSHRIGLGRTVQAACLLGSRHCKPLLHRRSPSSTHSGARTCCSHCLPAACTEHHIPSHAACCFSRGCRGSRRASQAPPRSPASMTTRASFLGSPAG